MAMMTLGVNAGEYTPSVSVHKLLKDTCTSTGQPLHFPDHPEVHGLEVLIPPGTHTGWHKHPYSGFAYVLQGTLEVSDSLGHRHTYTPGQAFAEVVQSAHIGRNLGSDTVKLAVFFFSDPGQPFTFKLP